MTAVSLRGIRASTMPHPQAAGVWGSGCQPVCKVQVHNAPPLSSSGASGFAINPKAGARGTAPGLVAVGGELGLLGGRPVDGRVAHQRVQPPPARPEVLGRHTATAVSSDHSMQPTCATDQRASRDAGRVSACASRWSQGSSAPGPGLPKSPFRGVAALSHGAGRRMPAGPEKNLLMEP